MINYDDRKLKRYIYEVKLLGSKDMLDVARESLNAVALQDKKTEIPNQARKAFTVRRPNFFTAMTRVNFSKRGQASKLNQLYSEVGFDSSRARRGITSSYDPLENMEKQEFGGSVKREVTPLNQARIGKSYSRLVSRTNMFNNAATKLIKQSDNNGQTPGQRMRVAMEIARRKGENYILADEYKGIYKIGSSGRAKRVFGYETNNTNRLRATHFNEKAAIKARKSMPEHFIKEAQKKIKFRASRI